MQRYEHKPVLLFIESYALDVIGKLNTEKRQKLQSIASKVWKSRGAEWRAVLREQLGWEETIDETIKSNWRAYRNAARKQDKPPDPQEFASMFADAVCDASQGP